MNLSKLIAQNKLPILMACSITGVIGVAAISARAGYSIGKNSRGEKSEKLFQKAKEDPKWFARTYIVPFIPTAILSGLTIASVTYSGRLYGRRIAAAESIALLASNTLKDYKESVQEVVSKKDKVELSEKVTEKELKRAVNDPPAFISDNTTEVIMFDSLSSRYFKAKIEEVDRAVNKFNLGIINGWYWASLNDFYSAIDNKDLGPIDIGNDLGWNVEHMLEITYEAMLMPESKRPVLKLNYKRLPFTYLR